VVATSLCQSAGRYPPPHGIYFGDKTLEEVHEGIANFIFVLAGLHAAAAIYEGRRHKENLVWAMVTGRKRA
jgi:cytochrome b